MTQVLPADKVKNTVFLSLTENTHLLHCGSLGIHIVIL
jgi:hypothetical protein